MAEVWKILVRKEVTQIRKQELGLNASSTH